MQFVSEKQRKHLEEIRKLRPKDWQNKKGAPSKEKAVVAYRKKHPDATMYRCSIDTGLSINTVKKWW